METLALHLAVRKYIIYKSLQSKNEIILTGNEYKGAQI